MSAIVKVENLTYIYNEGMPDATTALDNVSFEIENGEFVGLIGSTGCGKSTLVTHFNGLNKPTKGKVYIGGTDIWENPKDIRRFRFMVGLVFQYPEYQLFEETVYKDIAFGPTNMGLSQTEVSRRVLRAATACGIDSHVLNRSPFELSGGQKRRVAIAGVLAMEPQLLVLDEPAAGLDPEGRDAILSQIRTYHKETGTPIVLVSHSMDDIAKYADKVLVMDAGKIAMYDETEKIFARAEELLALGLSVPEVTKIFLRLKEMGLDIPTDVYTIPYAVKTLLAAKAAGFAKGAQ
ncbi:MAG: energy-coupling factor transporter ATPase [Ruthenibacterium sp.]